ncbi:uncharacterized protein LOC125954476 isoform X2 [Anopheles darlingi]|uniref:uncharacterized protein LOC125954476 isoform X2 n=1 Tax=Anopheles darlingi TaxID=43151 RepID=UPI0021000F7B|nr:uncharacterized protein LOC125954476 isoform X2 [Anopheles darlingi]
MAKALHIMLTIISMMMVPMVLARRIQLVNISPEQAQQYITQQSLDLAYAPKLGEHPVARTLYYNGRLIDNLDDYVEEEYSAKQFHGQDGLGRAMFGYSDHNQARLEARNANGEVRGSYQYVNPDGEDYIVHYWSDGLGFHQVDNRQIELPQPVQETPEVREARLAHMRAWEEAASLARANPDVSSDDGSYKGTFQSNGVEEDDESEPMTALSNQHQSLIRYPSLPYTEHIAPESAAPLSDEGVVVEAVRSLTKRQSTDSDAVLWDEQAGTEPAGEPKGFFYSFDYPVQLIAETAAKRARDAAAGGRLTPQASDVVESKEPVPVSEPVDDRISLKAVLSGEPLVDAVHDAQVSPKQKLQAIQA